MSESTEHGERVREALAYPPTQGFDAMFREARESLDTLEARLAEAEGITHQGHQMGPHRFSFTEVLLMFRALSGDEATARIAERLATAEGALRKIVMLGDTTAVRIAQAALPSEQRCPDCGSSISDPSEECVECRKREGLTPLPSEQSRERA